MKFNLTRQHELQLLVDRVSDAASIHEAHMGTLDAEYDTAVSAAQRLYNEAIIDIEEFEAGEAQNAIVARIQDAAFKDWLEPPTKYVLGDIVTVRETNVPTFSSRILDIRDAVRGPQYLVQASSGGYNGINMGWFDESYLDWPTPVGPRTYTIVDALRDDEMDFPS